MKKFLQFSILFILISTLFLRCCATKTQPVQVDFFAYKYVYEFKAEAELEGIDPEIINDSIQDIVFYPLDKNYYGLYSKINKQIVLNSLYAYDTIVLKKTIYHELGHLYGLKHDTGGIMGTSITEEQIHKLYCPTDGGSDKIWEVHKAYLFYKIRKHLRDLDKSK